MLTVTQNVTFVTYANYRDSSLTFFRFVITVFTKFSVMIERADVLVVVVLTPITTIKFITNLGVMMLVAVETIFF